MKNRHADNEVRLKMWFAHGRNKTIAMSPRIRILNSVGVVDCWLLDTCDAIMYRASNTISRVLLKIFLSPPHCCGIVERGVSFLEGMSSPPAGAGVRISAYTNQSRVSHSVRMRENSADEYPKQSSLERSF